MSTYSDRIQVIIVTCLISHWTSVSYTEKGKKKIKKIRNIIYLV